MTSDTIETGVLAEEGRREKLKVDLVGNPAMPMPVPIPDIVSSLPGMVPVASAMMRSKFAKNNVATIGELLHTAQDAGANGDEMLESREDAGVCVFLVRKAPAE